MSPGEPPPPDTAAAHDLATLRVVNEQLVVSTIAAQTAAEAVARSLHAATEAAQIDPLTLLPNRTLLLDRFAQASAAARRHGTRLAVLFLDLDNFKGVNDTLGHAMGDEVLRRTARMLRALLRAADTASRHGGDEFVLLLTDLSEASDALPTAAMILAAVRGIARFGETDLHLSASIGISIFPDDGTDADRLIDLADAAMYRAKRGGLETVLHHDAAPDETVRTPATASDERRASARLPRTPVHHRSDLLAANEALVVAMINTLARHEDAERRVREQAVQITALTDALLHLREPPPA